MAYRNCRILNKITDQITESGIIDDQFENVSEYELVEIPDDGKVYAWDAENGQIIEKTPTFEESKLALLEAISSLKKAPFPVAITDIDNIEGSYYLNLEDSTILKILVLVKKAEILSQASDEFINADSGIPEYKTFALAAIQQVQAQVIAKDDFFKFKANQVKNAQTQQELQTIQEELAGV
jgi:hypothetical protein